MSKSTKGARAVAAVGVVLLGGAGALAVWISNAPGVVSIIQRQWPFALVVIGLVGYAAALLVATLGRRRPRHLSS
jgi:hypothetical protein